MGGRFFAALCARTTTAITSLPTWVSSSSVLSFASKPVVDGTVSWTSYYKAVISSASRLLLGNGLTSLSTGTFPISHSSTAYTYDGNPNSVLTNRFNYAVPANPTANATPTCLPGGAIGVTLAGAVLYNPLDANGKDALINEMFDLCEGHPNGSGQYHYHHGSPCFADTGSASGHSSQIGYALDGFGIYGPWGSSGAKVRRWQRSAPG